MFRNLSIDELYFCVSLLCSMFLRWNTSNQSFNKTADIPVRFFVLCGQEIIGITYVYHHKQQQGSVVEH